MNNSLLDRSLLLPIRNGALSKTKEYDKELSQIFFGGESLTRRF